MSLEGYSLWDRRVSEATEQQSPGQPDSLQSRVNKPLAIQGQRPWQELSQLLQGQTWQKEKDSFSIQLLTTADVSDRPPESVGSFAVTVRNFSSVTDRLSWR